MSRYFALLSVVYMIAFVIVFDRVHQRNRNRRWLRRMYAELRALYGDP